MTKAMWVVLPFVALNLAALYHWVQAGRNLSPLWQNGFWAFLTGWTHVPDEGFTAKGVHHRTLAIRFEILAVLTAALTLGLVLIAGCRGS